MSRWSRLTSLICAFKDVSLDHAADIRIYVAADKLNEFDAAVQKISDWTVLWIKWDIAWNNWVYNGSKNRYVKGEVYTTLKAKLDPLSDAQLTTILGKIDAAITTHKTHH